MSGIFTSKTLAGGHLSNVSSVIYETPASNVSYIKHFSVTSNLANTIQTIRLFKRINGATLPWYTFQLTYGDTADILEGQPLILSANDAILANTDAPNANAVAYSLHGVEEQ